MKNLIGKTINQYQILLKIRETGSRILFKVYDTNTKRNLALDVIKIEENIDQSELFELLKAQALQNAKLVQSNIAVVIDSGIFEDTPYFVYNFSPFQPLRRLFNQKFSWRDSSQGLVAITQAVAFAHENGVVHGFLSPTNIILDENKTPYLFDFGFEQIIQKYVMSHLPGTWINNSDFAYCSPEQLIGEGVDARSDVYTMGLILYEWMTGEIAFLEETALATLYTRKILTDKILDLKKVTVPEIKNVIQKCIAVNPEDRYQSMQELSVLLARGALDIKITPKMAKKPLTPLVTESPNRLRNRIIFSIIIIAFLAILWGLNSAKQVFSLSSPLASATPIVNITKQKSPATPTPTSTPFPTPAITIGIKQTQAPNKIGYPVLEGTSLPISISIISPENSTRLITLSRWGIGELNRLAISPDGSLLAAASPVGVFLYKTDGLSLQKYLNTSSWVSSVAFSADGKKLAAGDRDGLIIVWDTESWNEVENHSGHKAGVLDLAFSPDGTELASIGADNTLIKWGASGAPISVSINGLTSLAYSSDGAEIITGGNDFKVNRWNAKNLALIKPITYSSKVVAIKVIKDTRTLIVGGADRSVTLIDLDTLEASTPFIGLKNDLSSLAVSPDKSQIVASDIYGGIVAWDIKGIKLWTVPTWASGFTPADNVLGINHSLVFSFNGDTVISGLRNGTIRYYKALTSDEIKQDNSLNNYTEKLVISHNSNFVLSQNNNGGLKMWNLHEGKFLYQIAGMMKQGGVFSLNDQYFAVAADAATIKVFETTSGNEVYTFTGLQNIQAVQFIQNDRFLVAGNDPIMRMWSLISGQEIKTIKNFNGKGCTVVYDLKKQPIFIFTKYNYVPNGKDQISFCAFQKVEWMKAISVNETNSNIAYGGNSKLGFMGPGIGDTEIDGVNRINIEKVAINTGKTLLAVAFEDHTIGIWDTATEKQIMQLFGPDKSITDLQFSPDGTFLLSSSLDGTIRVWGIP